MVMNRGRRSSSTVRKATVWMVTVLTTSSLLVKSFVFVPFTTTTTSITTNSRRRQSLGRYDLRLFPFPSSSSFSSSSLSSNVGNVSNKNNNDGKRRTVLPLHGFGTNTDTDTTTPTPPSTDRGTTASHSTSRSTPPSILHNHNNSNQNDTYPFSHPSVMLLKFQSYATNIARIERQRQPMGGGKGSSSRSSSLTPVRSLVHTLQTQTQSIHHFTELQTPQPQPQPHHRQTVDAALTQRFRTSINQAIVRALQTTAEFGDYALLLKIVTATVEYGLVLGSVYRFVATTTTTNEDKQDDDDEEEEEEEEVGVIEPRVFGEALLQLMRTSASLSKLKKVWNLCLSLVVMVPATTTTTTITTTSSSSLVAVGTDDDDDNNNLQSSSSPPPQKPVVLTHPPTAYELNAMIRALASRGKVRSAIDLYRFHSPSSPSPPTATTIQPKINKKKKKKKKEEENNKDNHVVIEGDEYTASILFTILAESIDTENDEHNDNHRNPHGGGGGEGGGNGRNEERKDSQTSSSSSSSLPSPCWQWRETERILKQFQKRSKLNNHSFAAALKVNERASERYTNDGSREEVEDGAVEVASAHSGAKYAFQILQRMKSMNYPPDVVTCSAVIAAFDRGKQWKAALALLHTMERNSSSFLSSSSDNNTHEWKLPPPNVYAYATATSACARCGRYEEAVGILDSMREQQQQKESSGTTDVTGNKNNHMEHTVSPNVYVYNSVLAACANIKTFATSEEARRDCRERLVTALRTVRQMEEQDNKNNSHDRDIAAAAASKASPDTVTYNTFLAVVANVASYKSINRGAAGTTKELVYGILDKMKQRGLRRDSVTYRNAILAIGSTTSSSSSDDTDDAVIELIDTALSDTGFLDGLEDDWGAGNQKDGIAYLLEAATSTCVSTANVPLLVRLFQKLLDLSVPSSVRSILHFIKTLGAAGHCKECMYALNAIKGDLVANNLLVERYDIDLVKSGMEEERMMIEEVHYSAAITSCYRHGEHFMALKILQAMKVHGLTPSEGAVRSIVSAYCKLATEAANKEFQEARKKNKKKKRNKKNIKAVELESNIDGPKRLKANHTASALKAHTALSMMGSLRSTPPARLRSTVACACNAAGMWKEALSVLRAVHASALIEKKSESFVVPSDDVADGSGGGGGGSVMEELPRLHLGLLKSSARSGCVEGALAYVDAIQRVVTKLQRVDNDGEAGVEGSCSGLVNDGTLWSDATVLSGNASASSSSSSSSSSYLSQQKIGMGAEEWHLLMIAASKSAHWKVCVGTLQFLRPFVERTHPKHARTTTTFNNHNNNNNNNPECTNVSHKLYIEHQKLSGALTAAVLAFEIRSQYAWTVRAIEDWTEWSGRRPPQKVVFAAFRALASRGQRNEVKSLIERVLLIPRCPYDEDGGLKRKRGGRGRTSDSDNEGDDRRTYEALIYSAAIGTLHGRGFYDDADELYAMAIAGGHLPSAIVVGTDCDGSSDGTNITLDLHGMSLSVAHAAVRVSFQHLIAKAYLEEEEGEEGMGEVQGREGVVIVTGRGKRSTRYLKPVLRPEVQRMLSEEFYPPLNSYSAPGNMGALIVPAMDVKAWNNHQQRQKSYHFLAVANILKDSERRLRNALLMKLKNPENLDQIV